MTKLLSKTASLKPLGPKMSGQVRNDAAVARIKAKASEHADNLRAIVEDIRGHGVTSVRTLAADTNPTGHPDGSWWRVASDDGGAAAGAIGGIGGHVGTCGSRGSHLAALFWREHPTPVSKNSAKARCCGSAHRKSITYVKPDLRLRSVTPAAPQK